MRPPGEVARFLTVAVLIVRSLALAALAYVTHRGRRYITLTPALSLGGSGERIGS